MNQEEPESNTQLTLKEFNEVNAPVLRTLDLHYFAEILKENEALKKQIKQTRYIINWPVFNRSMRKRPVVMIPADSEEEAVRKFILADKDGLIANFIIDSCSVQKNYKYPWREQLGPKYNRWRKELYCDNDNRCKVEEIDKIIEFLIEYSDFIINPVYDYDTFTHQM